MHSQNSLNPSLDDASVASLEQATLDAVAPLNIETYPGWLVPLDRSTIGRAKSAVPLRHHTLPAAGLRDIENLYRQWGLSAEFRIADVPSLDNLHVHLRSLGYQADQPTLVQTACVDGLLTLPGSGLADVTQDPTAPWAKVYTAPGFDPLDGANRVAALSRSRYAVYASVVVDGNPLAAGTAAFSQNWASIHGMRTVPGARGQGLASQILRALAALAHQKGLSRVFLQVEEDNPAALALYRRAGFTTAWRYHYWRKP